jgi:hypothetical protein
MSDAFEKFLYAVEDLSFLSEEGELDNVAFVLKLNDIRACLVDMEATEEEIEKGLSVVRTCGEVEDEDMAFEILMAWLKPIMKENIEIGFKNFMSGEES